MAAVAEILQALVTRIVDRNDPGFPASLVERLAVTPIGVGFGIHFHGRALDESYADLVETLAQPGVAPHVRSLTLSGPDEGANGTRNWNLEPLVTGGATFAALESLCVELSRPGDHNRTVVGRVYDEEGVIGRLLARCPSLREMTVPSAPAAIFFEVGPRPLRFLSVDAGYDTRGFIRNLAASSSLTGLTCLEWGEYNETYTDDYRSRCTPTEDYRTLFASPAFARVGRFVWRNAVQSPAEIAGLKRLRPDLQLLLVRTESAYE